MAPGSSTIRSALRICPMCGERHNEADTVCLRCGHQFPNHTQTQMLSPIIEPLEITIPQGSSCRNADAPIVLQIEGAKLALPVSDNITLGRPISQSNRWQAHIDLSSFSAHEQGVSRRHIRVTSRDRLTYVSDLSSTNGTWLNGQRLTPFNEYLLH